jgi:signal transduction histidine kinase
LFQGKIALVCAKQADGLQVGHLGVVVSQDHLGLFDTPPNRQEVRFAIVIVGIFIAGSLLILPLRNVRMGMIDAFVPMINATMFADELLIGTLLYAQAAVFRSRALTVLATGYVCAALLLIPHTLAFPSAFSPNGLLDSGISTTAWLVAFRRLAFPIAVILYVLLKRVDSAARPEAERQPERVVGWVLGASALVAMLTLLATAGQEFLPPLFVNLRDPVYSNFVTVISVTVVLTIVAMALLLRQQNASVLDMWLLVALFGWMAQLLMTLPLETRFRLGYYYLFGLMLVPNLIVTLALIAESNRLYAKLALAMSARNRERDARLMSMDAVAAAIGHEVKQPLTAIVTNASAGLRWLDRAPPNLERANESLRTIIQQGHHASDLITSVRSVVTRRSGERATFSLNDLVRETAPLLDRELALGNISLELALDDGLPPIVADRVQMQEVLINLFTNALQSLGATRGRPRRIAIRSVALHGPDVLLEVSDNGIGIAPEQVEQIFDFFFTTKATGTGMGLALCRMIVEQHGGRLWASQGEQQGAGATFHLQLPHSGVATQGDVEPN